MLLKSEHEQIVDGVENRPRILDESGRHHRVGKQLFGHQVRQPRVRLLDLAQLLDDRMGRVDFQLRLQDVVPLFFAEVRALGLYEVPGRGHFFDGDDAGVRLKLLGSLHPGGFGAELSLEPGCQVVDFALLEFVLALVLKWII